MNCEGSAACDYDGVLVDVMASAAVGTSTSGCTWSFSFVCQTGFDQNFSEIGITSKAMRGGEVKMFFVSWSFCRILKLSR